MAVEQTDRGFNIDVPLPDRLQQFLERPRCAEISLPEPASVSLHFPTGGTINGIGDVTNSIPTNCSLNFSLLLQLGPILSNLECFIRLLRLVKPLIDVVKDLPEPPTPKTIKEFVEAADDVTECIVSFTTPAGMFPFVKDILCLIIRILNCVFDEMVSLVSLMEKLQIDFTAADGNSVEQELIRCAQDNAQRSANSQLLAIEPAMVILEIAAPIFDIAQVGPIEIPMFGGVKGFEEMKQFVVDMEAFIDTLELIADGIGGCD